MKQLTRRDFLECIMVLISSSLKFIEVFAYVKAPSNSSFEIKGQNSAMSNCMKINLFLFFTLLNRFITVLVLAIELLMINIRPYY